MRKKISWSSRAGNSVLFFCGSERKIYNIFLAANFLLFLHRDKSAFATKMLVYLLAFHHKTFFFFWIHISSTAFTAAVLIHSEEKIIKEIALNPCYISSWLSSPPPQQPNRTSATVWFKMYFHFHISDHNRLNGKSPVNIVWKLNQSVVLSPPTNLCFSLTWWGQNFNADNVLHLKFTMIRIAPTEENSLQNIALNVWLTSTCHATSS